VDQNAVRDVLDEAPPWLPQRAIRHHPVVHAHAEVDAERDDEQDTGGRTKADDQGEAHEETWSEGDDRVPRLGEALAGCSRELEESSYPLEESTCAVEESTCAVEERTNPLVCPGGSIKWRACG
jgi:hypothetical protein